MPIIAKPITSLNPRDVERFWSSVQKTDSCWNWVGCKTNGYGYLSISGTNYRVHRISYFLKNGHVPESLCLDHLCRNKSCVNPDHLEPVTWRTNVVLRGTHPRMVASVYGKCLKGHPLDGHYFSKTRGPQRECKTCKAERMKRNKK